MSFIRKNIKGSLACESEIVGGDFYTITVKLFAAGTITMLDRVSVHGIRTVIFTRFLRSSVASILKVDRHMHIG